jgi:N-methylhydantoinase A
MMESGPVAGMIGAGYVARLLGLPQAIGFDMGGTTAKAALIQDGVPIIEEGYFIGGYASGQPMQLPVVAIVEVGAGGGSIAWRDDAGGLHVGPKSAGADPGPVCYRRGGQLPTVTDANVVLGRLNPDRFLGGDMSLDKVGARDAIATHIGLPSGLSIEEAAQGVVRIADTAMALAVRAVSVRKGVDPRDAAMIAFGGAGPVHAAALCKEIYIPTLIIPKLPGNFSALGMLLAPWRHDWVRTLIGDLAQLQGEQVQNGFDELALAARKQLEEDELNPVSAEWVYAADLRYRGQEHSITVGLQSPLDLVNAVPQVRQAFDQLHDQRYGHAAAQERVEVASLRLTVSLARTGDSMEAFIAEPFVPEAAQPEQVRPVIFDDPAHPLPTRILWRATLPPGARVVGPAVIEESNSTTLLYPGDVMQVSEHGHLVIQINLAHGESA